MWYDFHHVSTPPYIHDNHAVMWYDFHHVSTPPYIHDIICCDVMWCDVIFITYQQTVLYIHVRIHVLWCDIISNIIVVILLCSVLVRVSPCKVSVYCCVFVWCWMRIARKLLTLRDHVIFFLSTTTTSAGDNTD